MNTDQILAKKPRCYSYIRFSSKVQELGDSLKRQTETSEAWAKDHGLTIDAMTDLGKSAFSGAHIGKNSALGEFLELVRVGKIERGSYLLVESLDRLSRQDVFDAQAQFIGIINAGIILITLMDFKEYRKGQVKMEDLIYSIIVMSRAHDESHHKSVRQLAAWKTKRENLTETKATRKCPSWLTLTKDKKSFIVNEERAQTVKRIFLMAKDGIGWNTISKTLNNEKVKYWGYAKRGNKPAIHADVWTPGAVQKILKSTTTIGHFQPQKRVKGGTRKNEGALVKDYYPAIITEDLFYTVERMRAGRKGKAGGRNSNNCAMLFTRLTVCGYCGSTAHYQQRGEARFYVCCSFALSGRCKAFGWRYDEFEPLVLNYLTELDVSSLSNDNEKGMKQIALNTLEGKYAALKKMIETRYKLMDENPDEIPKNFMAQLKKLENDLEDMGEMIESARKELNLAGHQSIEDIKAMMETMAGLKGEELILFRYRLREAIRKVVRRIHLFPYGWESEPTKKGRHNDNSQRRMVVELTNGHKRILKGTGENRYMEWDTKYNGWLFNPEKSNVKE